MDANKTVADSFIFRAFITLKNGTRIYARQYGKKAFRIRVTSIKK